MKFKRILPILLSSATCPILLASMNSCSGQKNIANIEIYHGVEYGGIYFKFPVDQFNNFFTFGDSLNIKFSNGIEYNDVPFYNGYYVRSGQMSVISYPGYDITLTKMNAPDFWDDSFNNAKATITLNKAGKYIDIQNALNFISSTNREDYDSDEQFANFRPMNIGKLKTNMFYRSSSPCNDKYNRMSTVNKLCQSNNIEFDINLSEDQELLDQLVAKEGFNEKAPWFKNIYDNSKYHCSNLGVDFNSDKCKTGIKNHLKSIMNSDANSFLVHCVEGKDRTGAFCMILESLAGATYEEIINDYFKTYENMYHVKKEEKPKTFELVIDIKLKDSFLCPFTGLKIDDDFSKVNYQEAAIKYLKDKMNFTDEEIQQLIAKITQ